MPADGKIDHFVKNERAKATVAKTGCDMGVFQRWLESACTEEQRTLQDISPTQLIAYLQSFYLTVRKNNGDEYEPDVYIGWIQEQHRPISI